MRELQIIKASSRLNHKSLAVILILVLAISTGVATVIYFQSSRSESSSSPSSATASSGLVDGLRLSITLEGNKTKYSQGEVVNITFAVINESKRTQMFINENGNATFNFVVYNSSDVPIYSELFGAIAPLNASERLGPNQDFTSTLSWPQESLIGGFSQVPPGGYYIIGETGNNTPHELETARLNITILNE
jgi:hypothetical protein